MSQQSTTSWVPRPEAVAIPGDVGFSGADLVPKRKS